MSHVVTMPKLGLTMTEGKISKWIKNEGDLVKRGEPIFEVETDKMTNTIEAIEGGVLRKIIVKVGETAKVTETVAIVAGESEDISELLPEVAIKIKTIEKENVFKKSNDTSGKNVLVIGGGPGGYVAAIRAAQLGAKVKVVEKQWLGGTCLNVGCIPTKVLLHTAEILKEMKQADLLGICVEGKVDVDWTSLQNRKKVVVKKLVNGIEYLLKANKVEVIKGRASFIDMNTILIDKEDGSSMKTVADSIIIATGSEPFIPPIKGSDLADVIDSTGALSLEKIPESIVIIGGGVIGTEFATVFNSLGSKVTIVEMLPYILPPIDREIGELTKKTLVKNGIIIYNEAKVTGIEQGEIGIIVTVSLDGKEMKIEGDKALICVGRRAVSKGLNIENAGVSLNRGNIVVDKTMKTNVEGIYAIGDVTGINMLAHVASEQGVVAAETIMEIDTKMDYKTVPACVYTKPEIAAVGLTEEQVKKRGIDYKVGKFSLVGNSKAVIMSESENTVIKIITDKKYGEILGMHIYGPRATDLIAEGALALRLEATVDELISTVHAHPTVGEAVKEAALAVNNISIHQVNRF
ncbi:MAG TPA: dihydrolipoyl dehydrogenase [Clostridium sp.]|uniref:dihydrolipoyl dehydrogenase n=1 Tax=Clostridium sp. TaxID=1506 RepID=UPI002F9548A0